MGLLNAIGLNTKIKPMIVQAPASQSWWRTLFTSMNATEDCVVFMGGKKVVHKVPQFFWIHNAIRWAYDKNRIAKTGLMGGLEKVGEYGAKMGFRFLQLPLIKSVSPLMQGNLLFSLFSASIGSVFKLATGNVTGAIHNAIGAGAAIFGTAALAKYIPLAMGLNPLTGWAAAIGFGLTMFVEPKIRRLMGLDRDTSAQVMAADPRALLQQMQQAQQSQQIGAMQQPQSPYQLASSQGLNALAGGQTMATAYQQQAPYPYGTNTAYPYAQMASYGGGYPSQLPMAGFGYFGANPSMAMYYQHQQMQQAIADRNAYEALQDVASKFKGLARSTGDPALQAAAMGSPIA